MVTLTINQKRVKVEEGTYLLAAIRKAGFEITTLCNHEGLEPWGACRMCLVDITKKPWNGWKKMVVSCMYPVEEGLIVETETKRVVEARRVVIDLLLARCPNAPLIQDMAESLGVERTSYEKNEEETDCILCGLCTRVCDHIGVSAISSVGRGWGREIAPPFNEAPPDCIGCLACAEICPTQCIPFENSDSRRMIWGKEFEMQRCPECGRAYITKAQAEYYDGKNGVLASYFEKCDACKRKDMSSTFNNLALPG